MEETIKLYERNPYEREFSSVVVACRKGKKGYQVALEETLFFPEGGGQYGDVGWLNERKVVDTRIEDGVIWHEIGEALGVGSKVKGKIDFSLRFDRMQQHTGEHIFSGLVKRYFGFQNVGFHLGDQVTTMDFSGVLSQEDVAFLEERANEEIVANQEVVAGYPDLEALENMEYRSKIVVQGPVRVVQVGKVDRCACCAPHVKRTGEIGLLKVVERISYKGGVRLFMVCGKRAFLDYQRKHLEGKKISRLLSRREEELAEGVEGLKKELEETKGNLQLLKLELFQRRAKDLGVERKESVLLFETGLSMEDGRHFLNAILEEGYPLCGIFVEQEEGAFRYVIGSKSQDVQEVHKKFLETGKAKGGGTSEMVQGRIQIKKEEIQELWKF